MVMYCYVVCLWLCSMPVVMYAYVRLCSLNTACLQGSIGPQPDSQRPNSACAGIGTEPRLTKLPTSWVPGPGTYKTDQSLGPQRDSRRANSAKATFGGETRDGRNKQFMDEELEKTFYGRGSPGPMMYQANSSLGKQVR